MADTNIPQEDPTTSQKVGAKVASLIEAGHSLYAEVATGDANGRTRRPTLFVAAIVAIGLGAVWAPALLVALIAIMLLALTDQVVEL